MFFLYDEVGYSLRKLILLSRSIQLYTSYLFQKMCENGGGGGVRLLIPMLDPPLISCSEIEKHVRVEFVSVEQTPHSVADPA